MINRCKFLNLLCCAALGGCILAACASASTATPATSTTLTPAQSTASPTATDRVPTATKEPPAATPPATGTPLPAATDPPAATSTPESPATAITPAEKPAILSFVSTAYEVDSQEAFTLTWETSGGETRLCTIPLVIIECEPVPASGSQAHVGGIPGRDLWYALVIGSGLGEARSEIAVATRCLESWHEAWAVAEGNLGACPSTPYTPSAGAVQRFEHGLMIWLAASQEIFVFCDAARSSATYLRVADAWKEGMPDRDPELVPPAGSYQPVRGFGLVWRNEVLDGQPLREELGWAIEPESAFETAIQCALTQTKWGRSENCYLLGPNRKVYETIMPYGVWTKWPRE